MSIVLSLVVQSRHRKLRKLSQHSLSTCEYLYCLLSESVIRNEQKLISAKDAILQSLTYLIQNGLPTTLQLKGKVVTIDEVQGITQTGKEIYTALMGNYLILIVPPPEVCYTNQIVVIIINVICSTLGFMPFTTL